MGKFLALDDSVVFSFLNTVTAGGNILEQAGNTRLILTTKTTDYSKPRWGKVHYVGKNVSAVEVGEYVLIEHGMWTMGCDIPTEIREKYSMPEKVWKTDDLQILVASKDEPILGV